MKVRTFALAVAFAAGMLVAVTAGLRPLGAAQIVAVPSADQLRFQLVGNEPIAGPDGRALVDGWSVLMFEDRKSNQCYVTFTYDGAIATSTAACPQQAQR